jgi:hypothetical protein
MDCLLWDFPKAFQRTGTKLEISQACLVCDFQAYLVTIQGLLRNCFHPDLHYQTLYQLCLSRWRMMEKVPASIEWALLLGNSDY